MKALDDVLRNDSKLVKIGSQALYWCTLALSIVAIIRLFEHRWVFYFIQPEPLKDEINFVEAFKFYLSNDWYSSVANGSSPVFNMLGGVVDFFIDNPFQSLKYLNFLCLLTMIILWSFFLYYDLNLMGKQWILSILLLLQVGCIRHSFFSATNDGLFVMLLSLSFIYLYRGFTSRSNKNLMFALSGFLFAATLSVRELLFFYIPGIVFVMGIGVYLQRVSWMNVFYLCVPFLIMIGCIHYPSIIEQNSLSFHDKNVDGRINWAEGNYYEVLMGRTGIIHWDEVAEYKRIHGEHALPKTYFQGIIMNPSVTARNFFKQLYYSQIPFIRQTGLLFIGLVFMVGWRIFQKKLLEGELWIFVVFYVSFLLSFCIVVIRAVEFRWFMIFPFALSVFTIREFSEWINRFSIVACIFYLNLCVVALANTFLFGIW